MCQGMYLDAYPGQVECIRDKCSQPINVDTVRGIRHPYCSIECARACGENPQLRKQQPSARVSTSPPAYSPPITVKMTPAPGLKSKKKFSRNPANSYVTPPDSNSSGSASDADEKP
ncbi:hypothetical protein BGZ99_002132 [Dissophora globulifera]|uniref:Uncharacterized protein n=1 Tax=Dissophora globulifera TaxID=979702 RepID=A0A9P6RNY3_9FUNG|nr:hypothetical protein BGZ99_002132 [Dissophora globulifera]